MAAKGLLTRLTFSLVLVAGMVPWAMSQTRQVSTMPVSYQIWTPYSYGPNAYDYPGPTDLYAPDFMSPYGTYDERYGQLFLPPRFNPALPGSVPAPWQLPAPDWYCRQPYYGPFAYSSPFFGGYSYYPPSMYPPYYGWHGSLRIFARPNSQAPTEVPRGR